MKTDKPDTPFPPDFIKKVMKDKKAKGKNAVIIGGSGNKFWRESGERRFGWEAAGRFRPDDD